MRFRILLLAILGACGGPRQFGSLCDDLLAPPECEMTCDPAPGAPTTCPAGFHCSPDGNCDAQCTAGGAECGAGYVCTGDGRCIADDGGGGGDGPPVVDEACRHIDLVIAVDNSGSMQQEKQELRDIAFPGFAQALIDVAGGIEDFRVGVLDACPDPASYHTRGADGACDFQSGEVWMDSTSTALIDEFKCVGDIFSGDANCSGSNDDEQPITAATVSLEPAFQGPGMPNEGFLRDDALLVVLAITDEDETPTPDANAQEIFDRLVAIKGDVRKLVVVGIAGASDCDGEYGTADDAVKVKAATQLFIDQGRGVFYDLCQGDLEQGLQQALAVIDEACRALPPIL